MPEFARRYYALITREAEIQATDKDEYAHCEHLPSGDLLVRIGLMEGSDGERQAALFPAHVPPPRNPRNSHIPARGETTVRTYRGPRDGLPSASTAGGGADALTNSSQAGAAKTRFYDYRGKNRIAKGKGAKIDERPYKRPPSPILRARYALDWGMQAIAFPILVANPDLSVFIGGLGSRQYFGYRKNPFSSRHSFNAGLAINRLKSINVSYTGTFRQLLFNLDAKIRLKYSGLQVIRFNGFGNATKIPRPSSFYQVEQNYFALAPSLEFRAEEHTGDIESLRSELTIGLGPIIKYSNTPLSSNKDKFIGSLDHPVYGAASFGQIGAQGEILYDTRDNPRYATRGFFVRVAGAVYPKIWDVKSAFGSIDGEARTYATAPIPTNPTLALRAGGKKVWGTFPFHESAFLGGPGLTGSGTSSGNLRGFRKNRFAGDTALYGNSELRLVLARIKLLLPGELGLFGAADAGRVIFVEDPDDADTWHTGVGGGLWLSFLRRLQTLSVAVVTGDDLTGVYLRAGLVF